MIPHGIAEGTGVTVQTLKARYNQLPDDCAPDDSDQFLEVEALCNDAGKPYLVITTERWALNDIDEMIKILTDFKSRFAEGAP